MHSCGAFAFNLKFFFLAERAVAFLSVGEGERAVSLVALGV